MAKTLITYALLTAVLISGVTPVLPTNAAVAQSVASKSGSFSGASRKTGQGTVTMANNTDGSATLTFSGFKVSSGPYLHVWLSNAETINK